MSVKDNSFGIADLQDKMLDILKYLISVCEKNDLHYWLADGTCLGALRHQGFIPWDDDLDVFMLRKDYEKLWKLIGNRVSGGHYILCRTTKEQNYHHRVMQIVDIDTTFIHSRSKDEDIAHGVYIDIIPMDACPNNPFQRFAQVINAIIFSVYNIQQTPEYNGGKMTPIISFGTKLLLGLRKNPDSRYRAWKKAEQRMTKYDWDKCTHIKCITSMFKELFNPVPKEWYGERRTEFEDIQAVIPSNAESYCETVYGDYTTPPPVEKRTVRHHTEFIDLDNSYKKYKGTYYCVSSGEEGGN